MKGLKKKKLSSLWILALYNLQGRETNQRLQITRRHKMWLNFTVCALRM